MEISIIILSYKMKRLVRNCIRSIREFSVGASYEIIVVDNDSRDGIEDMMKSEFPEIKFILSPKNSGMGAGNNLGIREAQGKYILILNPDIYILDKAIDNLYNFIKANPQVGLVAPKLLNPDRTLQPTCYRWYGALTPLYRRTIFGKLPWGQKDLQRFLMTDYDHQSPREVDWSQGSCFMIPKKVFNEVGVFDENYFMYFEDTDLCRRIWRAGYKVFYLATTSVVHMHMKMSQGGLLKIFSNKLIRAHIRSWLLFLKKYRKELT